MWTLMFPPSLSRPHSPQAQGQTFKFKGFRNVSYRNHWWVYYTFRHTFYELYFAPYPPPPHWAIRLYVHTFIATVLWWILEPDVHFSPHFHFQIERVYLPHSTMNKNSFSDFMYIIMQLLIKLFPFTTAIQLIHRSSSSKCWTRELRRYNFVAWLQT